MVAADSIRDSTDLGAYENIRIIPLSEKFSDVNRILELLNMLNNVASELGINIELYIYSDKFGRDLILVPSLRCVPWIGDAEFIATVPIDVLSRSVAPDLWIYAEKGKIRSVIGGLYNYHIDDRLLRRLLKLLEKYSPFREITPIVSGAQLLEELGVNPFLPLLSVLRDLHSLHASALNPNYLALALYSPLIFYPVNNARLFCLMKMQYFPELFAAEVKLGNPPVLRFIKIGDAYCDLNAILSELPELGEIIIMEPLGKEENIVEPPLTLLEGLAEMINAYRAISRERPRIELMF
ncbi:MAG: hypothetical protein GXO26_02765 [Crenarchaeota archaeon]|nr:hypothetical protein [Thermoproteota archaeon]